MSDMPLAHIMPLAHSTLEEARAAKDVAKRRLARRTGIVGIGLTRQGGSYALKVNLGEGATAARLPKDVNGVPVVVATVGAIRKR